MFDIFIEAKYKKKLIFINIYIYNKHDKGLKRNFRNDKN